MATASAQDSFGFFAWSGASSSSTVARTDGRPSQFTKTRRRSLRVVGSKEEGFGQNIIPREHGERNHSRPVSCFAFLVFWSFVSSMLARAFVRLEDVVASRGAPSHKMRSLWDGPFDRFRRLDVYLQMYRSTSKPSEWEVGRS